MHLRQPPSSIRLSALLALLACLPAVAGEPARYAFDPVHTRVMFAIDHAGFSKAIGTISGSQGSLHFDVEDWASARLDVVVPMHRLDMGDSGWSASVFAPRFLDVKRHPQARFVATDGLQRQLANRGRACGQLTLHGVTRPLCLDVVLNKAGEHPMTKRPAIGFNATATIKRSDFGLGNYAPAVSDEVSLRITTEATQAPAETAAE